MGRAVQAEHVDVHPALRRYRRGELRVILGFPERQRYLVLAVLFICVMDPSLRCWMSCFRNFQLFGLISAIGFLV